MSDRQYTDQLNQTRQRRNNPWKSVFSYAVFGFIWIAFSDKLLGIFVQDSVMYQQIQTYKGWFYVFLTAGLLYLVIRLENRRIFILNREIQVKNQALMTFAQESASMDLALKEQLGQLNQMADEVRLQRDFLDKVIDNSNAAVVIWNLDGVIVDCNNFYKEMLGYGDELIGRKWMDFTISKDKQSDMREVIPKIRADGKISNAEDAVICKDGTLRSLIWNDVLIVNPIDNEEVVVSFGIDVTTERQNEEAIYQMAYYDKLTGLPNRISFEKDIQRYMDDGGTFSVYYIDIDHFKKLNDIHGHHIGDLFLVQFTNMLNELFVKLKLYRWGGDEFVIIDPVNKGSNVKEAANGILALTQRTWLLEDVEFHTTTSIGVVMCPEQGKDVTTLFKNLEIALYKAKENGRGRCEMFDPSFLLEIEKKSKIESAIGSALAGDGFYLNYQPIYKLADQALYRLEVLLRLNGIEDLNTHIGEVIAVAEDIGQIHLIDSWVIERVFSLFKSQNEQIPNLKVAINLSAQTFTSHSFVPFLTEMIIKYEVDPRKVEFEITEHTIVQNITESNEIMKRIKGLGFRIALDDFGTRYSSLNYLGKLPFDVLKVDKSYIDFILDQGNDYLIVKQIISLAKAIGLDTVGEGIESGEQERALKKIGCDYGQGYHYCRPQSFERIVEVFGGKVPIK